jgi:hypothetical protein
MMFHQLCVTPMQSLNIFQSSLSLDNTGLFFVQPVFYKAWAGIYIL